jgi:predicted phage-related endonuclease
MKILNLVQGSDEWLEARLNYLCASEAPVMMGASSFMSRNQLLDLKKGWKSNPVDSFKQRLFDKGHEHEESARTLLELDLLEDVPGKVGLVVIDGLEILASFDGYGEFGYIWEHKDWNEVLAENVRNSVLEAKYYWQLEQQMLVADATEVHFMVSDGTATKRESMIYHSVPERREQLIAGWKQFVVDLELHELEAKKEKVLAKPQAKFPSIECKVEGSVVISNLGDYIPTIQNLADEQMSIVLESDQDFADKEAFNKAVKEGRASLKAKAGEIETAFESLAEFNGYVKKADSILQKLQSHGEGQVKKAKADKKLAITTNAQAAIQNHLVELSKSINGIIVSDISANWDTIIKGKRSFEKMQEAVDVEVANLKIKANEISTTIRKNLDSLTELASDHKFLFSDHAELVLKDNDDLINLIKMRIAEHEKAEIERQEQERQRIQAEEEAKAKREAEAKLEQEREKIRLEEQARIRKEQEKAALATKVESQPAQQAEPAALIQQPVQQEAQTASPRFAAPTRKAAEAMVAITNTEYMELKQARDMLEALLAHGVDNWSGYSDAISSLGKAA